jgi:predicted transposase YdaD
MMTVAQQLREEGRQEAILLIARKMLASKLDIKMISDTTGLKVLEIQKLAAQSAHLNAGS